MGDLGTEGRRVAIEAIATLAYIKSTMVELILKPAGIPADVYKPLLYKRDEATGRLLTKRQIAPLILDALEGRSDCDRAVRAIVELAAHWSSFHVSQDEFAARAIVQKARELLSSLELMEAREAKARELARKEEIARMERERADLIEGQSKLLLMMLDELAKYDDAQRRGYLLQDLLNRTFDLHEIPLVKPFTRNGSGEQIDGAFKIEGWYYILECRWRVKLANIRELDGLKGQIDRSGKQTMGLFLSINGWSDNVPALLKQNPDKSIILMEGYDLRTVLAGQADLRDFLLSKVAHLNLDSEPFLSVQDYLHKCQ